MARMKQFNWSLVDQVRNQHPLVLIINNAVTANIVANAVNYIGASPIMIQAPEEAAAMVSQVDAICLNLGTINRPQQELMTTILDANGTFHRPVVLDPVAVGSSHYRLQWAEYLLTHYHIDCLRGNAGEVAALAHQPWHSHGIDSGTGREGIDQLTQQCAHRYHNMVLTSGPSDYVSDGTAGWSSHFTHRYFPQCVGTGGMLSAVVSTFLAVENNCQAVSTAVGAFTLTGQNCPAAGPSTWFNQFNDRLSAMTTKTVAELFEKSEDND